jgi:hypothetical protein
LVTVAKGGKLWHYRDSAQKRVSLLPVCNISVLRPRRGFTLNRPSDWQRTVVSALRRIAPGHVQSLPRLLAAHPTDLIAAAYVGLEDLVRANASDRANFARNFAQGCALTRCLCECEGGIYLPYRSPSFPCAGVYSSEPAFPKGGHPIASVPDNDLDLLLPYRRNLGCRPSATSARCARTTDVVEKQFLRVDVNEKFPFLVARFSPYYDRRMQEERSHDNAGIQCRNFPI